MSKLFISYRRDTAAGEARALFDDLVERLGQRSVFMDVDSIALGRDFRSALRKTLDSCDLMLVVIDNNWVEAKDEKGRTRLNDPNDFVRMEVEAALKRDIAVTPVLVKGAHMPTAEQLPAEIQDLAYRNAFELAHNRWKSDVQELVKRLGLVSSPSKQRRTWYLVSALIIVIVTVSSVGLFLHRTPETVQTNQPTTLSTPNVSPTEIPLHGSGGDEYTEFGGPPFCRYAVTLKNPQLYAVLEENRLLRAELSLEMVETAINCHFPPIPPNMHRYYGSGTFDGKTVSLTLTANEKNQPAATAIFEGEIKDFRLVGTLTVHRIETRDVLAWTVKTKML